MEIIYIHIATCHFRRIIKQGELIAGKMGHAENHVEFFA